MDEYKSKGDSNIDLPKARSDAVAMKGFFKRSRLPFAKENMHCLLGPTFENVKVAMKQI
jgi:hypothetical protein